MSVFLKNAEQKIINSVSNFLNNKIVKALFHVPLIGAFLALIFGVFLAGERWKAYPLIVQGISAQLFIPFVFAALAFIKYFAWFLGFESVNFLLSYVLVIYLLIGYALMLLAAFKIATGQKPDYFFFTPFLAKTVEFVTS